MKRKDRRKNKRQLEMRSLTLNHSYSSLHYTTHSHPTLLSSFPLLSSPPSIPLLPSSLFPSILPSPILLSPLLSSSLLHSPCFDFISRRRTDLSPVIFVLPFHSDCSSYSIETEKREMKKEIGINRQSKE